MKILFLINDLTDGGKERQLVELIKGLSKNKITCHLILSKNVIHYHEINNYLPEIFVLNKNKLSALIQTIKYIRKYKPDIVQSYIAETSFYVSICKFFLRFIFIDESVRNASPSITSSFLKKVLDKFNFKMANVVISNSKAGLISYRAPLNKSLVIHNGFDFSRIKNLKDKKHIRERIGITTPYVVGMVASFTINKDYDTFFKLAKQITSRRDDVTFVAIGDGYNQEMFKNNISPNRTNIIFTGRIHGIEDYINIFDIGVLLSNTNHFEGISNSIMEYMALGKPVIATEGGGTIEIVIQEKTGFLVKDNDFLELVRIVNFLIDNPNIAKKMGGSGLNCIKENFSIHKMVNSHYNIYNEHNNYKN